MAEQSELVREAIVRGNRRLEAAYETGNPAAVAELYTEEALLMPAGSETIRGRGAIAEFWRGVMELGIQRARLETHAVDSQGQTAIETGEYTLFGEGDQQLDRGKYVVVWKQARGEWRLHWDIWNTSVPPRG